MGVKQVKQKEQPKQKEWVRLDNASNIFFGCDVDDRYQSIPFECGNAG